ncbi:hypothetical protein NKR23_g10725 [Pleurostoma richardsiae]|uniref:BHLH domain-containing protein n=1 Tax=Pleurostoma richardsiae TaxID=41990 RepID=A0AA38VL18_9PEZI|nr:hypothetical protein NKR23_g10725 [Pleurostoma richardsiae]
MDPNNFTASGAGGAGFDDMDALLDPSPSFDPNYFFRKQSPSGTSAAGSRHGSSLFSATSPSNTGTSEASWHHSPQSSQDDLASSANDWNEWRDWVDFDWGQNGKASNGVAVDGSSLPQGPSSAATFDFTGPALTGSLSEPPLFQTMMTGSAGGNNFQLPNSDLVSPFTMDNLDTSNLAGSFFGTSQLPSIAEDAAMTATMPLNLGIDTSPQVQSSIETPDFKTSRSVSPVAPSTAPAKKRKLSEDSTDTSPEPSKTPARKGTQESQRHHSNIEKRYRNKLNDMIAALRDAVPSLHQPGEKEEDDKNGSSITKGRVLSKATEYILELEVKNKKLLEEKALLQKQVMALGKLNGQLMTEQGGTGRRSPGGGPMSKLMVGGMAGMLAMQGFSTPEGGNDMPSGRGLFALPVHLLPQFGQSLQHLGFVGDASTINTALHAFRGLLLLGAVLYVFLPSLFDAAAEKAKPSEKMQQATMAQTEAQQQQLASPKDLRRDAFLTATQGVWVPRKSLHIILAVILQATKLVLGSCGIDPAAFMRLLPSRAQEDSTRAWDIALDAQISGGDTNVTTGRLLVTLLAASSLPETPYRLMLRALHSHVLVASATGLLKHALESLLSGYSKKLWDKARTLQEKTPKEPMNEDTPLPAHLVALLELDAEDVFLDEIIERACHLIHGTQSSTDSDSAAAPWMHTIVSDAAIVTPLDFLAAWRAGIILRDELVSYPELHAQDSGEQEEDPETALRDTLELASRVAPPRSAVWSRSYVMRALLVEKDQVANISLAFKALLVSGAQSMAASSYLLPAEGAAAESAGELPGADTKLPAVAPDLAMALTCAIAISRLRTPDEEKALKALESRLGTVQSEEGAAEQLGMLGYVALYAVLDVVFKDRGVATSHKELCEKVAGMLRVWVRQQQEAEGSSSNTKSTGLGNMREKSVAGLCVGVLEWLVGIEGDGKGDS